MTGNKLTFKRTFWYLMIGMGSSLAGGFLGSIIIEDFVKVNLIILFIIAGIASYLLSYRLVVGSFKEVTLNKFTVQVLPLFIFILLIIGFIIWQWRY